MNSNSMSIKMGVVLAFLSLPSGALNINSLNNHRQSMRLEPEALEIQKDLDNDDADQMAQLEVHENVAAMWGAVAASQTTTIQDQKEIA